MRAKEVKPGVLKLFQVASLVLFFGLEMACGAEDPSKPETTTNQGGDTEHASKVNLSTKANKEKPYSFGTPNKVSPVEGEFVVRIHDDIIRKVMESSQKTNLILSKREAIQIWRGIKKVKGQKEFGFIPKDLQKGRYKTEDFRVALKSRDESLIRVGEIIKKYLKENFLKSESEIQATMSLLGMLVLKIEKGVNAERLKIAIRDAIKKEIPGIINNEKESVTVERNFRLVLHADLKTPPNDFYWLKPHHDQRHPTKSVSSLWGLDQINMLEAWKREKEAWKKAEADNGTQPKKVETVVAILDTGVDLTHPDLVGNLWKNEFEKMDGMDNADENDYKDDIHGVNIRAKVGTEFCANTNQKEGDPSSEFGYDHGTGPALVIGAIGNNDDNHGNLTTANPTERSTLGIGGEKNYVKIMPIRIFCIANFAGEKISYDGTSAAAIQGINYAIKMGANVINASWKVERPDKDEKLANFKQAIQDALMEGILFVNSAGNVDKDNDDVEKQTPPQMFYDLENMLVVAGTTMDGNKVGDSNFGSKSVHLAAPGESIMISLLSDLDDKRHFLQNGAGTSLAAPFVAGCAAFVQAVKQTTKHNGNDGKFLPPKVLKDILKNSVDPNNQLKTSVAWGGTLNCDHALAKALETRVP